MNKSLSIKHPSKLVSQLVSASSLWPRKLTKNSQKTPSKLKKMCDIMIVMKFSPTKKKKKNP
jgi:hypothetical protein